MSKSMRVLFLAVVLLVGAQGAAHAYCWWECDRLTGHCREVCVAEQEVSWLEILFGTGGSSTDRDTPSEDRPKS